jgi:hypothetical protein
MLKEKINCIEFITKVFSQGNLYDYVLESNKQSDRIQGIELLSEGAIHIHCENKKTNTFIFAHMSEEKYKENEKYWNIYSDGASHMDVVGIIKYSPRK